MLGLLNKTAVGLDISDRSIEVVKLANTAGQPQVLSLGRMKISSKIVEKGEIKDEEKLIQAIKKVFAEAKPNPIKDKSVFFSLPNSQVYTYVFTIKSNKRLKSHQLDQEVVKEANKNIPLSEHDLVYSFKIINKEKFNREIMLVAASRKIIWQWQHFFKKAKLTVKLFDVETLAIFRSLFDKLPSEPTAVIDMGSLTTDISIIDDKGLRYCFNFAKAGNHFTRSLANKLKLKKEEAEKIKFETDISKDDQNSAILIESLQPILNEIKSSFEYWQKQKRQNIKKVILIGGSAKLKGLVDYLSSNLERKIIIGFPALKDKKAKLLYLGAIGSALRGIEKKWSKDLFLSTDKEKQNDSKKKIRPSMSKNVEKQDEPQGDKSRIILLAIILILGVILIGAAFGYQKYKRNQKAENAEGILQYDNIQTIELSVPVAVVAEEYTEDRVRGRIVEINFGFNGDYEDVKLKSQEDVVTQLKIGEKLWAEPIYIIPEKEVVNLVESKWLVYSEKEASAILLQTLNNLNKYEIPYSLNEISIIGLEITDNESIFYLIGEITVYLNELINIEVE